MARTCDRCSALRAELDSCRAEADAIREDRAARVTSVESSLTMRLTPFEDAMGRWQTAALDLELHRAEHGC
jgi:hypothetical protein